MKIVAVAQNINENSTPNRLRLSLNEYFKNIEFKILTFNCNVDCQDVIEIKKSFIDKIKHKYSYFIKKIEKIINCYQIKEGFPFTNENYGIDISKTKYIKEADIIQLHWLGGYFLSSREIGKLIKLNKPIVFVCHDNGHFTGGCHVIMDCENFSKECGNCPQINSKKLRDWTYQNIKKKKKYYVGKNITVVSPSKWMDNNVMHSTVFRNMNHIIIPNSVNQEFFFKKERATVRKKYQIDSDKFVILFGAVNAVNTPYKGYQYLLESLMIFEEKASVGKQIEAIEFGSDNGVQSIGKTINIKYLGKLNEEEMSEAYSLADVYVVPSLEDSFNNTVAESMACETPVVAFATGGITDIIDHKINGYLAKQRDAFDLASGIKWVMNNNDGNCLGKKAKDKIDSEFTRKLVANYYYNLYSSLLNK